MPSQLGLPRILTEFLFPMKKITLALLVSTLCLSAQKPKSAEAEKQKIPQWIADIRALSEEDQEKYGISAQRCKQLFDQKRVFECLAEIRKAEEIYDQNPAILNLRGACYVEFRNFDKALDAFKLALEIQKGNFNVRFNIAEIKFVSQKYQESLVELESLLKDASGDSSYAGMIPLIKFKSLLCKLKLKDVDGAKKYIADTDFLSDSPIYYYGNAALEYNNGNSTEAEKWLARARRVFSNPKSLGPWQDTLIEFGYIKSFYGGDLDLESGPPTGE